MAGKRFRAEQIIMKLREAEVGLAQGQRVGQVSKQMGVSEQGIVKLTHHKLRQPQDIVSRTTPEYSMGRHGRAAIS